MRARKWLLAVIPLFVIGAGTIPLSSTSAQDVCDFTIAPGRSIQEIIDANTVSITICLDEGVFAENLLIHNRTVTIRGAGNDVTSIVGRTPEKSVVSVDGSGLAWIEGASITGGICIQLGSCAGHGVMVSGSGRATLTNVDISDNDGIGVWVRQSGRVVMSTATLTRNNIRVQESGSLIMSDSSVNGARAFAVLIRDDAIAEVRSSTIDNNGTNSDCQIEDFNCAGLAVQGDAVLLLADSNINMNANWGLLAYRERCVPSLDLQNELKELRFAGVVTFEGTNTFSGNNTTGLLDDRGNPGDHPFSSLPDGQVCLP